MSVCENALHSGNIFAAPYFIVSKLFNTWIKGEKKTQSGNKAEQSKESKGERNKQEKRERKRENGKCEERKTGEIHVQKSIKESKEEKFKNRG